MTDFSFSLLELQLERDTAQPLHRQLYDGLREAILGRRIPGGTRLPATRTLAQELGLSRNTVLNAFEQLLAEGYLEARVGDGTYVADNLPEEYLSVDAPRPSLLPTNAERGLSKRGELLARTPVTVKRPRGSGPFRQGLPDYSLFPFEVWAGLEAKRWKSAPRELFGYADPAGYMPLRQAIAEYIQGARGVRCEAEQVIITTGSQQGLDLAARVLLDPDDSAWIEDPGYLGARGALIAAGAQITPVPVDQEGLIVAAGIETEPRARLAYVTPSHQYPLGVTMSLPRRLALLQWASQRGAWIVEDDYDSEYRYAGRPLASLQGLDREGRVIYLGTFSKVMMPGLRLGYLVVPPDLLEPFVSAKALMDRHSPGIVQAVLADFIREGHFSRHIRRTRALYATRQTLLVEAIRSQLSDWLEVSPAEAGLHFVAWLKAGLDDRAVSARMAAAGIEALPVSEYGLEPLSRGGLMLGYAAFDEEEIKAGVKTLHRVFSQL